MSKANSAVDELSAIKERYEGKSKTDGPLVDTVTREHKRIILSPVYWRFLATLLAMFASVFLMLSYIQVRDIRNREVNVGNKEDMLKDYEVRASNLATTIGTLTAQSEALTDDMRGLQQEVANATKVREQYRSMVIAHADLTEKESLLKKSLDALKSQEAPLQGSIFVLSQERDSLDKSISKSNEQLKTMLELRTNTETALAALEVTIKDRRSKSSSILADIESKQLELQNVQSNVSKLIADKDGIDRQLELRRSELADVVSRIEKSHAEFQGIQTNIAKINVTLQDVDQQREQRQSELTTLNAKYDTRQGRLNQLEEGIGDTQKRLTLISDEKREQDELLVLKHAEIKAQEDEIIQNNKSIVNLKMERSELEKTIKQLQAS